MSLYEIIHVRPIHLPKLSWRWPYFSPLAWGLRGAGLLVAALILLVPAYLLLRVAGAGAEAWETVVNWRTLELLGNTVVLAVTVTAATAVLAVPLAWLLECTDLPGKQVWGVAVALPLVIPSYVGAFLFASMLGPKGLLQQALHPFTGIDTFPSFYGFPAAFLVLTLMSYPFTLLTVRAALRRMDPALVEAARSLGQTPRQAFWRVTLPYVRPSIVAGSLLVALYTLRDFGAVTMLQYSTFTRVIYNRYQAYRLDTAAGLALVLVGLTAVILYLEWRSRSRAQYSRRSIGVARQAVPVALGSWKWPALLFVGGVVTLALLLPVSGLLYWAGRGLLQDWVAVQAGGASSNLAAFSTLLAPTGQTLLAAGLAALLTMLVALPVSILIVRQPGRFSQFLEHLTYACFALPGIVVALAFVFFGTQYAQSLYQTLPLLLLGYVILFIPQAVGAQRASLLQVPPSLEEAARVLGKRPFAVLRLVTFPLVRSGMLAGVALVLLTAMKELPATLILSPLGFNTLAAQIWSSINEAFFARAALPTLLLLLLSSLPLAILNARSE